VATDGPFLLNPEPETTMNAILNSLALTIAAYILAGPAGFFVGTLVVVAVVCVKVSTIETDESK
jgi:hypothetical protein